MIKVSVALVLLVAATHGALAQNDLSPANVGSVGLRPAAPDAPTFSPSSGPEILRHRSPTGSLCLSVTGQARPHFANTAVYDHVITAKNNCAQRITIRVCYYKSMECMPMEIPGGERKEMVLGTLPGVGAFRFEFHEKS
jgi:hypothetical protein